MQHVRSLSAITEFHDFSGLTWETPTGTVRPTDMDGIVEFGDKGYLVFEIKRKGTSLPDGQRTTLYRVSRDFRTAGKLVLSLVLEWTDEIKGNAAGYRVRERLRVFQGQLRWLPLSGNPQAYPYITDQLLEWGLILPTETPRLLHRGAS